MVTHSLSSVPSVSSAATSGNSLDFKLATQRDRDELHFWLKVLSHETAEKYYAQIVERPLGGRVELSVFVGSWNLGNAPPPVDLSSWLPKDQRCDIVAVGVQECQYQPRLGISSCNEDWTGSLETALGSRYELVEQSSMWEIRIAVFARTEIARSGAIRAVASGSIATGVGGVGGNKGGVAVSFAFHDTTLCFVTAHLAAHQEKIAERNSDCAAVLSGIGALGKPWVDAPSQFDHTFFFGDLNYRIDAERDAALTLIAAGNAAALLESDQLARARAANAVLLGFVEPPIAFLPTYKLERGGGAARVYAEEKQRVPSYCDRILVRSLDFSRRAQCQRYFSAPEVDTSDHCPVGAHFLLQARLPLSVPSAVPDSAPQLAVRLTSIAFQDLQLSRFSALLKGLMAPPVTVITVDSPVADGQSQRTRLVLPAIDRSPENANNNLFSSSAAEAIILPLARHLTGEFQDSHVLVSLMIAPERDTALPSEALAHVVLPLSALMAAPEKKVVIPAQLCGMLVGVFMASITVAPLDAMQNLQNIQSLQSVHVTHPSGASSAAAPAVANLIDFGTEPTATGPAAAAATASGPAAAAAAAQPAPAKPLPPVPQKAKPTAPSNPNNPFL